jgi:hypothetical protein
MRLRPTTVGRAQQNKSKIEKKQKGKKQNEIVHFEKITNAHTPNGFATSSRIFSGVYFYFK